MVRSAQGYSPSSTTLQFSQAGGRGLDWRERVNVFTGRKERANVFTGRRERVNVFIG